MLVFSDAYLGLFQNEITGGMYMRRKTNRNIDARLIGKEDLAGYLGVGLGSAIRFGKEVKADIRIGKRVLYDRKIIDAAIDRRAVKMETR